MSARRLTLQAVSIAPFLMAGWLGVSTRLFVDDWRIPQYSPGEEARLCAYREPVRHALALRQGTGLPDANHVRAVACEWLNGSREGKLHPLFPSFYGDSFQEGPKEQVLEAEITLLRQLRLLAEEEARLGRFDAAAGDLASLIEVGEVLKPSDFVTVLSIGRRQSDALSSLEGTFSKLRPDSRQIIESALCNSSADRLLNDILQRSRRQYVQHCKVMQLNPPSIEDVQMFVRVGNLMKDKRSPEKPFGEARRVALASRTDMPILLNAANLAWLSERQFEAQSRKIRQALLAYQPEHIRRQLLNR